MLQMESLSTTTEFDRVKSVGRTGRKPTDDAVTSQFCLDLLAQHIFDKIAEANNGQKEKSSNEIDFTANEKEGTAVQAGIKVVALQFPDYMLPDSPLVVEVLEKQLTKVFSASNSSLKAPLVYILADTSYSPCCVDTVAAKHVSADLIVHFGNACLNPVRDTPVVYIFGKHVLDLEKVEAKLQEQYGPTSSDKILFMYDPEFEHALTGFTDRVKDKYPNMVPTYIQKPAGEDDGSVIIPKRPQSLTSADYVQNSKIPVRTYPKQSSDEEEEDLSEYTVFYVMSPNPSSSLLLHLTTLVQQVHLLEAPALDTLTAPHHNLMRRYRYMNMARTAATIGILINTLSLRDVGPALKTVQGWIQAASKKSYTFVVGKPNVPKLANFDVIDVWVVLGCPLGGIIVDCDEYYKPIITPYELNLALQAETTWTGKWLISLQDVLENMRLEDEAHEAENNNDNDSDNDSQDDPDAPVFDPVTGKYVSTSRPLRQRLQHLDIQTETSSEHQKPDMVTTQSGNKSLTVKHSSQLVIKDTVSTAADHLYNKLSWTGLGSDFGMEMESDEEEENGGKKEKNVEYATVEKGRAGVARGYRVLEHEART